jgi:hypothetical protein
MTMNKLTIVLVTISAVLSIGFSSAAKTSVHASDDFKVPAVECGTSVEVPAEVCSPEGSCNPMVGQSITIAEVPIVGHVGARSEAPKELHLVCGQMHDNWVGGHNSDCSWR